MTLISRYLWDSQICKKKWKWFLIWSPHMSSCLPTLAPSDTKNFIWSILSWLTRMMIFPPPPQSWAKNKQHIKKNNPLGVSTEKPRPLEASPIFGHRTFFRPGLQRDFLHRPEPVKQHDARRFHCFFCVLWREKSGQQSNKGRTSIFYTIKNTFHMLSSFWKRGMNWGFPIHVLFFF